MIKPNSDEVARIALDALRAIEEALKDWRRLGEIELKLIRSLALATIAKAEGRL